MQTKLTIEEAIDNARGEEKQGLAHVVTLCCGSLESQLLVCSTVDGSYPYTTVLYLTTASSVLCGVMAATEELTSLKPKMILFIFKVEGYVKLARSSLAECFDGTTIETAR